MCSFLSQNIFVPTQSQEASSPASESQRLDSCPFSLPLQLSVNAESCGAAAQQNWQRAEEDSQATQIEEPEEPPAADASDSVTHHTNKTSTSSQGSCAEEVQVPGEGAENSCLNVPEEDVKGRSSAEVVSCSERMDSSDVAGSSCVQETPSNSPPCGLTSPAAIPPTAAEEPTAISVTVGAPKGSEEEEVMEEECTVSGDASGVALALSQSQLLTPEPMEEDSEEESQLVQKDGASQVPTSSSQPGRGTANGHEPQVQVGSSRTSQGEGAGPDAEGIKDKILSDSSGGKKRSGVRTPLNWLKS